MGVVVVEKLGSIPIAPMWRKRLIQQYIMPALRFQTCRLLSGNVRKRELTIIQRRILRRLRKKVLLFETRDIISNYLVQISILLFLLDVSYCMCILLGSISIFQEVFWKIGFSLGGRALSLALCKLGCSGGLSLAIGFAVRALLTDESAPYLANRVLPEGSETNVNQEPHRNDGGPSNTGEQPALPHIQYSSLLHQEGERGALLRELHALISFQFKRHCEINRATAMETNP